MTLAVSVHKACVRYESRLGSGRHRGERVEVPALQDISFELRTGEALGLLGHNGAGKSTLLAAVAGLLPLSSGQILVSSQPQLLGVGAALDQRLTGTENIRLCCFALGLRADEIPAVRDEITAFTELDDFIDLPVMTYSSGMRQRLAFAIAAIARPEILLIDEALAVGDRPFRDKCIAKLKEIRDDAGVVLLATHSMKEIRETCSAALWLRQGRIVMLGDVDEITTAYERETAPVSRKVDRRRRGA